MSDSYVFPQGIVDETTGKEIRRAGGLTYRQLVAVLVLPSLIERTLRLTTNDMVEAIENAPSLAWEWADALIAAEKP